jgi:hypothetical protein
LGRDERYRAWVARTPLNLSRRGSCRLQPQGIDGGKWSLSAAFTEVESGKKVSGRLAEFVLVCGRLAEFVLAQLSGAHDARRATS